MASGTISFQSNDKSDIFHVAQVVEDGLEPSDETVLKIEDSQFDGDKAWVTGHVPKMRSVNVEGDTTIINAWFRAQAFDKPFVVRVYVECELAEELEQVVADERLIEDKKQKDADNWLEPNEIHL
jgi:hypothetical protein